MLLRVWGCTGIGSRIGWGTSLIKGSGSRMRAGPPSAWASSLRAYQNRRALGTPENYDAIMREHHGPCWKLYRDHVDTCPMDAERLLLKSEL